jgi:hypothetical protein
VTATELAVIGSRFSTTMPLATPQELHRSVRDSRYSTSCLRVDLGVVFRQGARRMVKILRSRGATAPHFHIYLYQR